MLRPLKISSKEVLELIYDYQENPTKETFSLLLLKFDKLLVYIILKLRKRFAWLREVDLRDLYHTAILGFAIALKKIPEKCNSNKIPAYISAYVKAEIRKAFSYKRREIDGFGEPPDLGTIEIDRTPVFLEDFEKALENAGLSEMEKECIRKKFCEFKTLNEISIELGIKMSRVYRRIQRGMKRLRKYLFEE